MSADILLKVENLKKQNDGCEGGNVFTAIHIQTRSKKKWKLKKETFTTHIWIVA